MSAYSFSVPVCPVSPRSRCSSCSSSGSLEFIPSAQSDDCDDDKAVVEGVGQPDKHKGKEGLWSKGKPHHKKLVLSKKFVKDLGPAGAVEAACAAAVVVVPGAAEQDGESFFMESNTVKRILLPGSRAKTSIVWNFFHVDPQYACRAICSICKKSVSRGKPGTHLGTSTLQRHLQAKHSLYCAMANTVSTTDGSSAGEEEYAFNVPVSPGSPDSRFSSFNVGPTGTMAAASAAAEIVVSRASGEDRKSFLIESNTVKRILVPGTRTKTSAVWNFFYTDPQHTCRAVCNVCKKSVSRGRPGTHLGTSTLQRHLQAIHPVRWAMANKSNGSATNGVDEETIEDFSADLKEMDLSLLYSRNFSSYFSSWRDKFTASYSLTSSGLGVHAPTLSLQPLLGKRKFTNPNFETEQDSQISTTKKKTDYHENPVAQKINRAITELIIEDIFMQIVAPGYQLPSRTYFSMKAVPRLYNVVREKVFKALEEAECRKVHLTIDMWTHEPTIDYLIVVAHWVSFERLLSSSRSASKTPSCRKQAALCVTGFAKDYAAASILQELNYQIGVWLFPSSLTPGFIVSDNTASVMHAVRDGDFTQVPCFMHYLNLVIQDFLCEHKSTGSMLSAAREICHHFNHSVKARQILQEFQHANHLPQQNLKQEIATQWTSTFYMLRQLLEQRKAVHDYSMQHHLGRVDGVILTSFQWCLMADICDILEPFEEQVLPLIHRLLLTLQNMRKDFQIKGATAALRLVDDLTQRLETDSRLSVVLRSEHYILATLLDPCFKDNLEECLPRGTDVISYKRILIEAVSEHMCTSVEGCTLEATKVSARSSRIGTDPFALHLKEDYSDSGPFGGSSLNGPALTGKRLCPSAAAVVEEYFQDASSGITEKDDPLTYWKGKQRRWPALTQVAIQYLSCPPCSLHSECVFSTASINYDYSPMALGFDTENETQRSEDEMF
uniref:Zinc finger BED-type containing 6 n=1 Tax=Pelusios castaneus TaxID=367368 RepID=A0A8C8SEH9_9SAUR